MTTTDQPDAKAPPELEETLRGLGIDPSVLTGAGASSDRSALFGVEGVEQTAVRIRNQKQYLPARGDYESGFPGRVGPENSTVLGALTGFYSMRPDEVVRLKQRLWANGFYEGATPPALTADPDDETFQAYRKAVLRAARSGESIWDDILKPGSGHKPKLSKEELAALNEQVIPNAIGRALTDDEMQRFATALDVTEPTRVLVPAGDILAHRARQALKESAPGEVESYGVLQRMNAFFEMLDGPMPTGEV